MVNEELLTVKDVAARLRVHPETVRTWLREGRLRGRRMSDRMGWRVPVSEVDRFITEELLPETVSAPGQAERAPINQSTVGDLADDAP